ncbi:MAG: HDOD domain-containing protein [Lachnospiraceae bacterium]|jgi:EAL and modified HD-GYP domain-containing signal transduction protein|nr:HDOD domain-containing protein [Lachnospiraceae bacterium]SDA44376.1 EAL and modified HD-GYP domain-containing signal transduction protein [Lachnospiraceae bacterium G11]
MLATLIPLFDENISVKAYSLFSQKKNLFLNPSLAGTGYNDGAGNINGLDIIDSIGINNLVSGADVFVPVTDISLFTGIENLCKAPAERIVLLIDNSVKPEEQFIKRIKDLRSKGYKFAIRKLTIADFEPYRQILLLMDYILLNHRKLVIGNAKIYFSKMYPNIKLVACGVDTMDDFKMLKKSGGYSFYEGDFYRLPITKGAKEVSPLKTNYIELLNIVNGPDFDLTDAADVIGRDTALVISLLEIVNRIAVNSEITSIRHAAAMLGQKELKKWITTAVTKQLCDDKPSEISRTSLLRAKFAENLANLFDLGGQSQELFMMGLFSIIDIILDKPMKEALEMLHVSKNVQDALVEGTGPFAPIIEFIQGYEVANWALIDRVMLMNHLESDSVYVAYIDSLKWFKTLFPEKK